MEWSNDSSRDRRTWQTGLPVCLSILLALCCASATEAQPARGFTPQWKTGDTWTIQTNYTLYQVRAQPAPTAMLRWSFEVTRATPRAVTIMVRSAEQQAWARLEVDRTTMSVTSAEFHSTVLGREQVTKSKYSGKGMVPRAATVGVAPTQIPLFPLGVEPEARYYRDVQAGEQTHEVLFTQRVTEMTDAGRVRQLLTERLGSPAVVPESRRYFIVTSVEGSNSIEQVWAEGVPWFLYSRTPDSTSSWVAR